MSLNKIGFIQQANVFFAEVSKNTKILFQRILSLFLKILHKQNTMITPDLSKKKIIKAIDPHLTEPPNEIWKEIFQLTISRETLEEKIKQLYALNQVSKKWKSIAEPLLKETFLKTNPREIFCLFKTSKDNHNVLKHKPGETKHIFNYLDFCKRHEIDGICMKQYITKPYMKEIKSKYEQFFLNAKYLNLLEANNSFESLSEFLFLFKNVHTLILPKRSKIWDLKKLCDRLPELQGLYLHHSYIQINQLIPLQKTFPKLNFVSIESLFSTKISPFSPDQTFEKMKGVSLPSKTFEDGTLKSLFTAYPKLRSLNIKRSRFNLQEFESITPSLNELTYLDVGGTRLQDRHMISISQNCSNLRILKASLLNQLTDIAYQNMAMHLHQLEILRIDGCKKITGILGNQIFKKLKAMNASHTKFCDQSLPSILKNGVIQKLRISHTQVNNITDTIHTPSLEALVLESTNVNDESLVRLVSSFSKLKILKLNLTAITSQSFLFILQELKELVHLEVENVNLNTAEILQHANTYPNILVFNMTGTSLPEAHAKVLFPRVIKLITKKKPAYPFTFYP